MTDLAAGDVVVHRDVVVTQLGGYRALAADLYLPPAPAAVCVYLHGGGWRRGSRRAGPGPLGPTSGRLFERMARRGLAVVSADYRLSGEARYPAQSQDVATTVGWCRADTTYGVGALPVCTFGVSAGGQLATVAALDASLDIAAATAWYPVTDLLGLPDDITAVGGEVDRGPGSREALVLGAPAADVPQLAASASAVTLVHPDAPPLLLLHGSADDMVPSAQSRRLHDALLAVGASCTLEIVDGYGHFFAGMPDADVDSLTDRTTDFLLGSTTG